MLPGPLDWSSTAPLSRPNLAFLALQPQVLQDLLGLVEPLADEERHPHLPDGLLAPADHERDVVAT